MKQILSVAIWISAAFLVLALIGGCSLVKSPTVETWPSPPVGLKMADADTASMDLPALLSVVQWMAFYGWDAFPSADKMDWAASYPSTGSTVSSFIWEARRSVGAAGIPASQAAEQGLMAEMVFYVPPVHRGSFLTRVAAVDSAGIQGPWSLYGAAGDTLEPEGP